ncbi:MAG: S16 family serine protease, partial [Blastocatellia bacterium]
GYTEEEKLQIILRHLLPKQMDENGIKPENLTINEAALRDAIAKYTRESGLRQLEREIGKVCRKIARRVAEGNKELVNVTSENLSDFLGVAKIELDEMLKHDQIGVATGLAVTATGGDILFIEALTMRGKGALQLTGQLGEVMRESAHAAYSFAKSRAKELGIEEDAFTKTDIHLHIPEGAIPKDGPSAGITMATALVSVLAKRPINKLVAMTGEITLRGNVLAIGGVKEKVLAAHRAQIKKIILPAQNKKDMEDVPEEPKRDMEFVFVENVLQVFQEALLPAAEKPKASNNAKPATVKAVASKTVKKKATKAAKGKVKAGK